MKETVKDRLSLCGVFGIEVEREREMRGWKWEREKERSERWRVVEERRRKGTNKGGIGKGEHASTKLKRATSSQAIVK